MTKNKKKSVTLNIQLFPYEKKTLKIFKYLHSNFMVRKLAKKKKKKKRFPVAFSGQNVNLKLFLKSWPSKLIQAKI